MEQDRGYAVRRMLVLQQENETLSSQIRICMYNIVELKKRLEQSLDLVTSMQITHNQQRQEFVELQRKIQEALSVSDRHVRRRLNFDTAEDDCVDR